MTGRTHLILGACAGVPVSLIVGGHLALPLCVAAGAVGGLLPDIDQPQSELGRLIPWPYTSVVNARGGFVMYGRRWFAGKVIWHRHETHSVGGAFIASGVTWGSVWAFWWVLMRWAIRHGDLLPTRLSVWLSAGRVGGVVAMALLAGYVSHLVADLVNVSPQMLWWPVRRKLVHIPGWHGIPERSAAEHWTEAATVLAALVGTALLWGPRPL